MGSVGYGHRQDSSSRRTVRLCSASAMEVPPDAQSGDLCRVVFGSNPTLLLQSGLSMCKSRTQGLYPTEPWSASFRVWRLCRHGDAQKTPLIRVGREDLSTDHCSLVFPLTDIAK